MSIKAIEAFSEFLESIPENSNYRTVLQDYENIYNLKKFKITEILVESALPIFQHIVDKFYKNHQPGESGTWVQNELRLFLWTVICYIHLQRKNLSSFQTSDWNFFSSIFFVKEFTLFEYQARILLDDSSKITKWSENQDDMLSSIIMKDRQAKWNQIAKALFIKSNKTYLRASKQCRERWLNHLDPTKSKSIWNLREYLIMFEQVAQKGKKWALIVKNLKDRRSEHSIKNKYHSIIKKQMKYLPQLSEHQICEEMIKKINKIMEGEPVEPHDQYLFGCSLKQSYLETEFLTNADSSEKKEDGENYKAKFENFRKKLQNFQNFSKEKQLLHSSQNELKGVIKQRKTSISKDSSIHQFPKTRQYQSPICLAQLPEDEIFYEESIGVDEALRFHQFNVMNQDFKSMFKQHHGLI